MKLLVVGQGGREHALCWKLSQSPQVSKLYCAPGNPGIGRIAENVAIAVDDLEALVEFARSKAIDLTVVGPEYPLSLGLVDCFAAAGLRIFGPSRKAAQLESSKDFAKRVMNSAKVPTARHCTFEDRESALRYVRETGAPLVIKADGLAAGKGVFVCQDLGQAEEALAQVYRELGQSTVVVEECLSGKEASFIVAAAGKIVVPLAASHDYKRIRDFDEGPNTGGMGAVSPTSHLTAQEEAWVVDHVIHPVLSEMERQGAPFCGFLYAGLMIGAAREIKVLEFNVRLGDPETQVILRRMRGDLCELLCHLSDKPANAVVPRAHWSDESAVCVVMASAGYPESSSNGDVISGLEDVSSMKDVEVFHAGTAINSEGKLVTNGGRVLNITACGKDLSDARRKAYRAAEVIQFRGRQFRRDIAE
jgi:phosphoribosylamine---glycine ligase